MIKRTRQPLTSRILSPGFTHLLNSEQFEVMDFRRSRTVYQDMNHPLSSYFIATSHNT